MRLIISPPTVEIALPSGVAVTLRPLSGPLYHAAQMAAAMRAQGEEWPEGLDRANEAHRLGVGTSIMAQEVARLAVVDWSGIEGEDGDPLACTPENAVLLVVAHPHDGAAIQDAVSRRAAPALEEGRSEGKKSAPG